MSENTILYFLKVFTFDVSCSTHEQILKIDNTNTKDKLMGPLERAH